VEVGQLAERTRIVLGRPDLGIFRPPVVSGPDNRYVGDGVKFRTLLAQTGATPASLDEGIRDTAAFLASRYSSQARALSG
jgi:hypothetical protein